MVEAAHPDVALPDVCHRTVELPATIARVVVIGDVHGCFDELQALLRACAFDASRDQLVFVGDLMSKGPKPIETIRFVRESGALCVRGNHDDAALAALYDWRANNNNNNNAAPRASYSYVTQLSAVDVQFLEQLPFSIALPAFNAIVVHAGLVPGVALADQRPVDVYKMRFVQRTTGELDAQWQALETRPSVTTDSDCGELHRWATQWRGPMHVLFGHDALAGLQREAHATGIDTGCCYGRELSACILPSREIVQVPALRAYVEVPAALVDTTTVATVRVE